jgi:hypothetical protein
MRPARVGQAEHLGGLVKGLTGGVIQGLAQDPVLADGIHPHQLGVAA